MHVGHPYIPLFKIQRIFNLLVSPPFLIAFRQVVYNFHFPSPSPPLFPHCSIVMRFVTNMAGFVHVHTCTCFYCYILTFSNMTIVIVCMLASSIVYIQVTITSLSFYLPVSEIVTCCWCYCCFRGTICTCTLFATVFTVITLVC